MDDFLLVAELRPVDVDGFNVSFGSHTGDILINHEGRRHKHHFISPNVINNRRDYEAVMMEAFLDFVKTAKVGCGQRKDYVRDFGWRMSKQDVSAAWRDYRSASIGLRKLLGYEPSEFFIKYSST
jgi:hypothetical protein